MSHKHMYIYMIIYGRLNRGGGIEEGFDAKSESFWGRF